MRVPGPDSRTPDFGPVPQPPAATLPQNSAPPDAAPWMTSLQFLALLHRLRIDGSSPGDGAAQIGAAFDCPRCLAPRSAHALPPNGVPGNRWRCSGCEHEGDEVDLVASAHHVDRAEAADQIREALGRGLYFGDAEWLPSASRVYLTVGIQDYRVLAEAALEHSELLVLGMLGTSPVDLDLIEELLGPHLVLGISVVICCPNEPPIGSPVGVPTDALAGLMKRLERRGASVRFKRPPAPHRNFASWHGEKYLRLEPPESEVAEATESPGNDFQAKTAPTPPTPKARPRLVPVPPVESDGGGGGDQDDDGGDDGGGEDGEPELRLFRSYASLTTILRTHRLASPVLKNGVYRTLEFNEMLDAPTLNRKPVTDDDYAKVRDKLERTVVATVGKNKGQPLQFSTADIAQALCQVSRETSYHPVREYLDGLEWQRVSLISEVHREVLRCESPRVPVGQEAEAAELEALVPTLIRKWFVSAVARVYEPGCKVDTMLVLVGPQEIGKSSFFRILASEPWFSDTSIDISRTDALLALKEVWVNEWPELEAIQRARDYDQVKAFLSSTTDRFRRPYGRNVEYHRRGYVIVGTTNHEEFLTDPTGNRRYWPVLVRGVDTVKLRAWRDQLWAEAVAIFREQVLGVEKSGQKRDYGTDPKCAYHLTPEESRLLKRHHRHFDRHDPWENVIAEMYQAYSEITTDEVLAKAVQKPTGQWTRADQMRVAAILVKLGFERIRRRDEHNQPRWVYQRKGYGPASTAGQNEMFHGEKGEKGEQQP